MVLSQDSYRDRVAASVRRTKATLVSDGYSLLAACALLPILVELAANPAGAYRTVAAVLGGIGGNLIANIAQGVYDQARSRSGEYDLSKLAAILEKQVRENDEISKAMALLVENSGAIGEVYDVVRDLPRQWEEFSERLLSEVTQLAGTGSLEKLLQIDNLKMISRTLATSADSLALNYLRTLVSRSDELRLGTIDPKFELESPIKLSQVYVHPLVYPRDGLLGFGHHALLNPLYVISDGFVTGNGLGTVVLGGPGAGKSALVDRLCTWLGRGLLRNRERKSDEPPDEAWRQHMPGWIAPLVLPVKVSLQEL